MTKKTISRDDYLKALGLFTLALQHVRKADEFERSLHEHLGMDVGMGGSHISDSLYGGKPGGLDEALKLEGIEVEAEVVR